MEADVKKCSLKKRLSACLFLTAGAIIMAGCQGGSNDRLFASKTGNDGAPVQLLDSSSSSSPSLPSSVDVNGNNDNVAARLPVDSTRLAKAVERYRLNKKQKKSPYRSVGTDLNGDGQAEVLVLLEGEGWCARTGCTLAIFTTDRLLGYRPVTTIRRVRGPVIVTPERNNGWNDLVVNTGIASRNQRVRLRFGSNGYPGNAITLTPMPADVALAGQVVIEQADILPQEMVSNSKP